VSGSTDVVLDWRLPEVVTHRINKPGSVMLIGIVTETSSVVAQVRVDSGNSIANGGVV